MRIVIEVDGQTVTAIGPDAAPVSLGGPAPMVGDQPPGPAPAALLERARKLGAKSAGAAQFGRGAALASTSASIAEPRKVSARKAARKRARRSR